MTTRVKVDAFLRASQAWFARSVAQANQNGNAYLTIAEAQQLPKDLRDNFESWRKDGHPRVSVRDFEAGFLSHVEQAAKAAAGADGLLTPSDVRKLPKDLRDNFRAYLRALEAPPAPATPTEQGRKALGDYVRNVLFNTGNPEGAAFQREVLGSRTPAEVAALRAQWEAAAAQWAPGMAGWEQQPQPDGSTVHSGGMFGLYTEVRFTPGQAPTVMVEID